MIFCFFSARMIIMAVVVFVEVESSSLSTTTDESSSSVYQALQQLLGVSAGERRSVGSSTAASLPSYMMELYEKYRSGDLIGTKQGNTVRSIHASRDTHTRLSGDLIFNLTGIHPDEHVIRAEIHYYLRPRRRHFNVRGPPAFRANFFVVNKKNNHDIDLDSLDLPVTSRGWNVIDVTKALTILRNGNHVPPLFGARFEKSFPTGVRYFKLGKWKTLPFLIIFSHDKNSLQDGLFNSTKPTSRLRLTRSTITNRVSEEDFMEDNNFPEAKTIKSKTDSNPGILHPRKPKNRRLKRPFFGEFRDTSTRSRRPDKPANEVDVRYTCQRKKLTVNFAQIGWGHWIISPKTFEAHYCAGACVPLTKNVRPSNHATIQSLIHALGARENVPPPCCVPETMSSLTLLYLDEDKNVILKNYPQMTVENCACR